MKFLSKKEVCAKVALSRAQIARLEQAGKFPQRIKLGDHVNSRAVWVETEVVEWMEQRLKTRRSSSTL